MGLLGRFDALLRDRRRWEDRRLLLVKEILRQVRRRGPYQRSYGYLSYDEVNRHGSSPTDGISRLPYEDLLAFQGRIHILLEEDRQWRDRLEKLRLERERRKGRARRLSPQRRRRQERMERLFASVDDARRWLSDVLLSVWRWVGPAYTALGASENIRHYWRFEWHGFFGTVVTLWGVMRTAATLFFHVSVTIPAGLLGWHVEVPVSLRDYFSVGLFFALNTVQARLLAGRQERESIVMFGLRQINPVLMLIFWPAVAVLLIFTAPFFAARYRWVDPFTRAVFTPYAYLALLLALNFGVMPYL